MVAQDVTAYGDDLGRNQTVELLDALNQVEGIHWIRLLYAYPERVTDDFIAAMARNDKVLPYLDLPIQHINSEILRSMNARGIGRRPLGDSPPAGRYPRSDAAHHPDRRLSRGDRGAV